MLIKLFYNQNTFAGLEYSNFTIFDQQQCFKFYINSKNYKCHSGIQTHVLLIRRKRSNTLRYAVR